MLRGAWAKTKMLAAVPASCAARPNWTAAVTLVGVMLEVTEIGKIGGVTVTTALAAAPSPKPLIPATV